MAVELLWDVTLSPVSVGNRVVNIVGVASQTETEDPENHVVIGTPIVVRVNNAPFANIPEQTASFDVLYNRYLAQVSRNVNVVAWLVGKEVAAKAYLEGK